MRVSVHEAMLPVPCRSRCVGLSYGLRPGKCEDDFRLGQGVLFGTLLMGWTLYIGI